MIKVTDRMAFLIAAKGYRGDDCILWPFRLSSSGYGYLYHNYKFLTASRLVCEWRHGPPPPGMEAAHECGNRPCVNSAHLSWKTKLGNVADRERHNRTCRGERSPAAKLTETEAREIRASGEPTRVLAARYDIHERTVCHIRTGRRWSHLSWSEPKQEGEAA